MSLNKLLNISEEDELVLLEILWSSIEDSDINTKKVKVFYDINKDRLCLIDVGFLEKGQKDYIYIGKY